MSGRARPVDERVWRFVDRAGPPPARRPDLGPCWLWTGARNNGYGAFSVRGDRVQAHRSVWEVLVGPCPAGLEPDHLCCVKHCVNPAHLEWVTHAENVRRAVSAGVGAPAAQAAKETCPRGHPYDMVDGAGRRRCRRCRREANAEAQRARRARVRAA